jgi:dihydrodipicolinate synthase/N-acetylneuraminate lyase
MHQSFTDQFFVKCAIALGAALDLSKHARANGADAISSVPPIYFKYTTEEIIAYYLDLIELSDMPLVVYNIPAFTGVNMTQGPIRELFKHPRVVAQYVRARRILAHNPSLIALNGYDEAFLSGLSMGGGRNDWQHGQLHGQEIHRHARRLWQRQKRRSAQIAG